MSFAGPDGRALFRLAEVAGETVVVWLRVGNHAALAEHTGPWTPDDVEGLPDAGDHARFEVYEGGVLVVSPAPGVGHQRASYRLHSALAQAAIAAGADVDVLEAVNVALPGGKLLVPDVVVVAAGAVGSSLVP